MIKRTLFPKIKQHLAQPEISLIIGPRQAGKTTLMKQLKTELDTQKKPTLYLNFDIDTDRPHFETQEKLVHKIQLEIGGAGRKKSIESANINSSNLKSFNTNSANKDKLAKNTKGYIFLDEIQRKTDAGLFLKGLYDRDLPYKFIVSGSGSVELKEQVHESLAGRKRTFELGTLSFREFVNYKTQYKYEDNLRAFFEIEPEKRDNLFLEYLSFGGYPRVVLSESVDEKRQIIEEIYQSYLEKDLAYLLKIKNLESLTHLVFLLANQVGSMVNKTELSSTLGIARETVANYLWYLQKTFTINKVTPFFRNPRKEITKSPIFYFTDLGLVNFAKRSFRLRVKGMNDGHLFENFVYLLLRKRAQYGQVHYYRTKSKAEVDFIVDKGERLEAVEVKYKQLQTPNISRSFRNFLREYQPQNATIVHLGESFGRKCEGVRVEFKSFWEIC